MSTALARRRASAPATASGPIVVQPASATEIHEVLRNPRHYPSPVRPVGSGSSTTRCTSAGSGTVLDLSAMNRVLRIDEGSVTVQPGISLPQLAEALSEQGLELVSGFDLANRTVGGSVCAAGLEASMAGEGQFAAHVLQLKALTPQGKKFVIGENSKNLLALLRLSYGLLGVVYEITLRVRPVQGFSVQTAKSTFRDFAKLSPKLASAGPGLKLYLLPFRDRIYIELRRPGVEGDPGRKFAWRLKDWAVYSALPEAARSLGRVIPFRQIRYPLIDGLSTVTQSLFNGALVRSGSNAVEQTGRLHVLNGKSRFDYCTWAFPVTEFGNIVLAYKLFCQEHYARTGFRCDMPAVSFRLNQDRTSLLSPSFNGPMLTISALSTQTEGWDEFAFDLAEFAGRHAGVPLFNQTRHVPAAVVNQRFGSRLAFFKKARAELDPYNRMLNQFFAAYLA